VTGHQYQARKTPFQHQGNYGTLKDFYDINIKTWCKAIIADNTKTNIKIAKDLQVPHVGCYSHKLNLDVEAMLRENDHLTTSLAKIHEVMVCAKQKLRNAAVLRNITDLRPVLENKTRWSGKVAMLTRFIRFRQYLIEAADHKEADGLDKVLDRSGEFLFNAQKYEQWLSCINTITKKLQEACLPLSTAHHLMDFLESEVVNRKNKESDALSGCTFERDKSSLDNSELCPNKDFETGVAKIQLGKWSAMSGTESKACQSLLTFICNSSGSGDSIADEASNSSSDEEPGSPSFDVHLQMQLEKRANEDRLMESPYVNTNFIFGSTAEVKRLWSISSYILTKQRQRMTPQLFEAILFLRYNERFWDLSLVADAMKEDRLEQRAERLENLIREDESEDNILLATDSLNGD
jgi:hypothetical protein